MIAIKYQTVEELEESKSNCEKYIYLLSSKINGQSERLKWINKYLFERTPQEMSIKEIEIELGHKVIIKGRRW